MQCNMLMLSWVAGALPTSRHQALLCSASSVGYTALRQSLGSALYPQHTILLTNVDIRDVTTGDDTPNPTLPAVDVGEPYSLVTRVEDWDNPAHIRTLLNTPLYYYKSNNTYEHTSTKRGDSGKEVGVLLTTCTPRTYVSVFSNIKKVPSYFLSGCNKLIRVNLQEMCNIRSIGDDFIASCSSLQYISLNPLANVTIIPIHFLNACHSLRTLDFTPMSKVNTIEGRFLNKCRSLKNVNLSGLENVTELTRFFLYGCKELKEVDLSPFTRVTAVDVCFLSGCGKLESVELSPLARISKIAVAFLNGCGSLTTIDFSHLRNVRSIGGMFLTDCVGLTSINFRGLENVTELPTDFLSGCISLKYVDLTPFSEVIDVVAAPPGRGVVQRSLMFAGCTSLTIRNPPPALPPPTGCVVSSWSKQ